MKFSSVLVTGGAGFVGSHLLKELIKKKMKVYVVDNLSTGKRENIPQNVIFIEEDITSENLNLKFQNTEIDVVIHLAAYVSIRGSTNGFLNDANNNIIGTLKVLELSKKIKVKRFIYSSSMAVYGDSIQPVPINENYTINPYSNYGISKYSSELYVNKICEELGISSIILRYFNIYGANQSFTPYVGVITIFLNKILQNKPIKIFGDGNQCRDFVHVSDIVRGIISAITSEKSNEVYNLGSGVGCTVNKIVHILSEQLRKSPEIIYLPKRSEELINSIADISKATQDLGYLPKYYFPDNLDYILSQVQEITEF